VALFLIPVVVTGHAIKAVVKFDGWVTYLPGAWRDPVGLATARSLTTPAPLLPAGWIGALAAALLVGCLAWAGWWITRRLSGTLRRAAYAGAAALGVLYAVVVAHLAGS
jgi:hypothetical protein